MGSKTAATLLEKIDDAHSFTRVIIDTIREPLLVLDGNLKIQLASESFHRFFKIESDQTQDCRLFAVDGGVWETPELSAALRRVASGQSSAENIKFTQNFPRIGERTLHLHVLKAPREIGMADLLLIGFEDITDRWAVEREKERLQKATDDLLRQKQMLLEEMEHRIVNSLQITASILMLKARAVSSVETRGHLQDAHRRVMSLAAVHQHLRTHKSENQVEIGPYLTELSASLCQSMIGEGQRAAIQVSADKGALVSADAAKLGLIVTELVINALKYAFPDPNKKGAVTIGYEVTGANWKLWVADNGVGQDMDKPHSAKPGLGASLITALADQLGAEVQVTSTSAGMTVTIIHLSLHPPGHSKVP